MAVSILVSDSDEAIRHVGEVIKKVTDDLKVDSDLVTFLAGLASNPGAVTAQAALEAIGKTTAVIADVLQQNRDDFVGTYVGLFPPLSSWDQKLYQDENGASIRLVETASDGLTAMSAIPVRSTWGSDLAVCPADPCDRLTSRR